MVAGIRDWFKRMPLPKEPPPMRPRWSRFEHHKDTLNQLLDSVVNSATAVGYFEHDPLFVNELQAARADLMKFLKEQMG